jgi:hypothetical protein|tara:strand:+ start:752 stop:1036 length:285 start_codon:yes stop_codon:yes gene_type:complete
MYYISENGDFPAQYFVLKQDDDGILRPVFGPDPDLEDAERKHAELSGSGKRARNDKGHFIADDESTPDVNEAYVSGKAPLKKKSSKPKKKSVKK